MGVLGTLIMTTALAGVVGVVKNNFGEKEV